MKCTRKGCGAEFNENDNTEGSCTYHSGGPVFHEGLKSWSCCADKNKPVLDFESFMAMPGCATGTHTAEQPKAEPARSSGISNFKEEVPVPSSSLAAPQPSQIAPTKIAPIMTEPRTRTPVPIIEEEDDLDAPVPAGGKCLRTGCNQQFIGETESRRGDGPESVCVYHSAPPLFREGSKGYLCCKRRVLEFDEFLKIEGCKRGRHLFVKKRAPSASVVQDQLVTCRIDHYQTPSEVYASVFAKQADKGQSSVRFEETKIDLDISLPGSKRFIRTLHLYGPINPSTSSFTVTSTKIDLVLAKRDHRSWNSLEQSTQDIGHVTFGVGGRTGSIGGKELVLDETNKLR